MNSKTTTEKQKALEALIKGYGSVLVAFSAGVDSSFLTKVARDILGRKNVLAVTGRSASVPKKELADAEAFVREHDIEHLVIDTDELDSPDYVNNPIDRCYHCKSELFDKLTAIAKKRGIAVVADGANADDISDYRPGARASIERQVKSPLQEVGLTKSEIRKLSKDLKLTTWNKPAMACLASRIAYGDPVTIEALLMIEKAEEFLKSLGFGQLRVRRHDKIARIEFDPEDIPRATAPAMAQKIDRALKEIGFGYVSVDLFGYRTGSMNHP